MKHIYEFIKNNTSINHLDISNNLFTFKESMTIKNALDMNNTILGIHFLGHYGYVNSMAKITMEDRKKP